MEIDDRNFFIDILEGHYGPYFDQFKVWPCIAALGIKPFKDGDQWCFLYGDNIQDGIAGFGDTVRDAAMDFYNNLCYEETYQSDKSKDVIYLCDGIIKNEADGVYLEQFIGDEYFEVLKKYPRDTKVEIYIRVRP